MVLGALMVVVGSFVATDGGFASRPVLLLPHRTLDVVAPATGDGRFLISDSDTPGTKFEFRVLEAQGGGALDGGIVSYGDLSLARPEPLSLHLERPLELTLELNTRVLREAGGLVVETSQATYVVQTSAPLEDLGGGRVRVRAPVAAIDLQLRVLTLEREWPGATGVQCWGTAMVWDPARGRLTRFGGIGPLGLVDGTFVWDERDGWQKLAVVSPPPRYRAVLVNDPRNQHLLLFGGLGTGDVLLNDTWEFDGDQWRELHPATRPPPRWSHSAAFEEDEQRVLLFGGLASKSELTPVLGDTWAWDGTDWTQLHPASSPVARDAFGLVWDGNLHHLLMVGGWNGNSRLGDMWLWQAGNWVSAGTFPGPPRSSHSMAWNPVTQTMVVAAGLGMNHYLADRWIFDGITWQPLSDLPDVRARMAAASHPRLGTVAFGGHDNQRRVFAETGILDAPRFELLSGHGESLLPFRVVGGGGVVGTQSVWRYGPSGWTAVAPAPPSPRAVVAAGGPSPGLIGIGAADGGTIALDALGEVEPPPHFAMSGSTWLESDGGLYVAERDLSDGGARVRWRLWAPAPTGLRALEQRAGDEWLLWTDRLFSWTPADGGLQPLGSRLVLDGGLQLHASSDLVAAVTDDGTWLLTGLGSWVFVGAPRAPQFPLSDDAVVTHEGVSRWDWQRRLGSRCTSSFECGGGPCVDGRCCDRACSEPCEACSVETGSFADGTCAIAAAGKTCFEEGCLRSTCTGLRTSCPEPADYCPPDAGPVRDAGSPARDAGPPETAPPRGCACGAVEGLGAVLAGLWLRRRR